MGKERWLKKEWIDHRRDGYSHFDLIGPKQKEILLIEGLFEYIWE